VRVARGAARVASDANAASAAVVTLGAATRSNDAAPGAALVSASARACEAAAARVGADPAWIDAVRRGRARADRTRRDPLLELPEAERARVLGLDEDERFSELVRLYDAD